MFFSRKGSQIKSWRPMRAFRSTATLRGRGLSHRFESVCVRRSMHARTLSTISRKLPKCAGNELSLTEDQRHIRNHAHLPWASTKYDRVAEGLTCGGNKLYCSFDFYRLLMRENVFYSHGPGRATTNKQDNTRRIKKPDQSSPLEKQIPEDYVNGRRQPYTFRITWTCGSQTLLFNSMLPCTSGASSMCGATSF